MKVCEVLDDAELLKQDVKTNKGRAVKALVSGAKRKSNGVPREDNEIAPETNTVSESVVTCKYCREPAINRLVWAEGRAVVPVCAQHQSKGEQAIKQNNGAKVEKVEPINSPLTSEKN